MEAKAASNQPRSLARRVEGTKIIQPADHEARAVCAHHLPRLTASLTLCLSETGVPEKILFSEYSGLRGWDRKLFETMRTWRYEPYVDASGRAAPVCTGVTFIYEAGCR